MAIYEVSLLAKDEREPHPDFTEEEWEDWKEETKELIKKRYDKILQMLGAFIGETEREKIEKVFDIELYRDEVLTENAGVYFVLRFLSDKGREI